MIESVNNERVKYWTKLNEKKYQKAEKLFLVEGEHLVYEALKSQHLKEVIVLNGYDFEYDKKTFVSENVMRKISNLTNIPKLVGVVKMLEEREINGNVLMLDQVSDPGNLGTIIRSSVAFGIDTIILGRGCVSVYNPKVVRATEGQMFNLNIIERHLEQAIEDLRSEGYKIYATDVEEGETLYKTDFAPKTAIVMGNEGAGVSSEIKSMSDEYLYIEMNETCESLNVGVATSIILYELYMKSNIQ